MTEKHILLLEGGENDIELTFAALAKHVANAVVVARDGAEAVDYLFRRGAFAGRVTGPPALVMLDLKMPKVGGVEVLWILKADPAMKRIPMVMLSSAREQRDVFRQAPTGSGCRSAPPGPSVQQHPREALDSMHLAGRKDHRVPRPSKRTSRRPR